MKTPCSVPLGILKRPFFVFFFFFFFFFFFVANSDELA
jgi:hypothetical protein